MSVDELEKYLDKHSKVLKKYYVLFQEFADLYLLMNERKNFLKENQQYSVSYILKRVKKCSKHKDIDNRIKKAHKKLIGRINEVVYKINLLKRDGQIKLE